jgi:hypothetical protein
VDGREFLVTGAVAAGVGVAGYTLATGPESDALTRSRCESSFIPP